MSISRLIVGWKIDVIEGGHVKIYLDLSVVWCDVQLFLHLIGKINAYSWEMKMQGDFYL